MSHTISAIYNDMIVESPEGKVYNMIVSDSYIQSSIYTEEINPLVSRLISITYFSHSSPSVYFIVYSH